MSIKIIYKLAGIGILTAFVNHILKLAGKDEIATITTLAGSIIALLEIINMLRTLFNTINSLFEF